MQFIDESNEVEQFQKKIAEIGFNTYSCHGLGLFHHDGRGGLERSGKKAVKWFTRCLAVTDDDHHHYVEAFDQIDGLTLRNADEEARKLLPDGYDDLQVDALVKLYWIKQNTRTLGEIFDIMAAAKSGDAEAQFELGDLFMNADTEYFLPVSVRPRDGCEWMEKAAIQQYTKAYLPLARYYRNADYATRDPSAARDIKAAFYWAEQAFHANPKVGWKELADYYLLGHAVEKDIEKYIQIAESSGDFEYAPFELAMLFITGKYIEIDADRAAGYFAQCRNQGFRELGEVLVEKYHNTHPAKGN